jgi:hypothetical protein
MTGDSASSKQSAPAAQPAEDALVLEIVDGDGTVELVFGTARVPGRLLAPPRFLLPGSEHEVMVVVVDESVGVAVRVVVGCEVTGGAVARIAFAGLDVAGRRLTPSSASPPALTGRLDEVPLVDVVQLVCVGRRTAAIDVQRAAAPGGGVILCRGGRAVYAGAADGTMGEPAFYALVGATGGTFTVRYDVDVVEENLGSDTNWLLLEAMRRLDEAVAGVVPVLDDAATTAALSSLSSLRTSTQTSPRADGVPSVSLPSFDVALASFASAKEPSRDEEHAAEPVFTPRDLRRHSLPPTSPVAPASATTTITAPPRAAPPAPTWPSLPSRATGRFARFFHELSETAPARPATSSLPPVEDLGGADDDRVDVVAALFDSDDGPAVDDDATARLRFSSLKVRVSVSDEANDRDTEIVRSSRNLST